MKFDCMCKYDGNLYVSQVQQCFIVLLDILLNLFNKLKNSIKKYFLQVCRDASTTIEEKLFKSK